MTDKQLAVFLGENKMRLYKIHQDLEDKLLESEEFSKSCKPLFGSEYGKYVPILADLNNYLDQLDVYIETLRGEG